MKIDLTKNLHQDNLKAEIYHQFQNRFWDSALELRCEYKVDGCRFDLIAYDVDTAEIFVLIEVRRINARTEWRADGRKHIKYSKFNKPILYISEFNKIQELLDEIENCYLKTTTYVL